MRPIDADRLANLMQNDLEGFETMISEHGKGLAHGTRIALNRIAEQPTISPESLQPQWIPVTERLPYNDDFVMVIVSGKTGNITLENAIQLASFSTNDGWILEMWPEWEDPKVNHWLPLPEPYTAKVEENEGVQPAHWEKADIPLPYQMRTVPTPSGTFAHREMYVCSACDGYNDKNTQYCPHCGAKMDNEVNDDD